MKKVRFGVVGTNFITDWVLAGAAADERFELTAVCSRSLDTARSFAAKYGAGHLFTSVEDMARSPHVDAVYIASPNFMHASQALECMRHGKHVLCEKPLASNAVEVRAMIDASQRYDVTLMEAMKTTLTPNFRKVMELMPALGQVRRYFSSYCQYSSRYDRFKAGELPNAFNPAMSNGAIMDIGVYTIYPMVVLFGRPERVMASGLLLSSGADGQGSAVFRYPEFDAVVLYSKISDSMLESEIQGESGTLTIDRINRMGCITFAPHVANGAGGAARDFERQPVTCEVDAGTNDYRYEITEFIDLVIGHRRQSDINSHENSLITMEIVDEIRRQIG
ncbi:MAG: Gfo/Idh/MocA family oxidoreductase, partial [Muribaculaceae bacterium]|nr:Gfo/Idh/MocA family oxidoreductase [Muribaculaceae bacterium]